MDHFLNQWQSNPGIVKQLQAYLLISILINLSLAVHLIRNDHKQIQENNQHQKSKEPIQITLKDFIPEYTKKMFATDIESEKFLETHSAKSLFTILKEQLLKRREQQIQSLIEIEDLYIDTISSTEARSFITGIEKSNSHQIRSFNIELIINPQKGIVDSIPKFKISESI